MDTPKASFTDFVGPANEAINAAVIWGYRFDVLDGKVAEWSDVLQDIWFRLKHDQCKPVDSFL